MANLMPKNESTLRAILKIGNATLHDVEKIMGSDAKNAINSLYRCGNVKVVATKSQKTRKGVMQHMHVYAITEKGKQRLADADLPLARQMKALKVPINKTQPNILHPNVRQMVAEIDGRMVKITYGVHLDYEVYRPAPDRSRNYTPRPISGILA
jgi:hypothetical protein